VLLTTLSYRLPGVSFTVGVTVIVLSQGWGGGGQHLCLAQTLFVPLPVKVPHIPHVQSKGEWRKDMRVSIMKRYEIRIMKSFNIRCR
jgi:hypothetical protein